MHRRHLFENFCESFIVLYNAVRDSGDSRAIAILDLMQFRATIFTRSNMVLGSLAIILFSGHPLLLGTGKLPYGVYIAGVDFRTSPAYQLGYALCIASTILGVTLYIPFINIVMSFIIFGITLIQNLNAKFRTISETSSEEGEDQGTHPPLDNTLVDNNLVERRFKLYIEYHKRIIRYVEEINELISFVCLVEIILFGGLLSALLFLTVIVKQTGQFVFACIYIFMILFQLFNFYWLSNELIQQSGELGYALYDSPWYTFSVRNRKTLLLTMARAQQPLEIMLGNVAPITLQTFQSILNVSYSYFTVMRRNLIK